MKIAFISDTHNYHEGLTIPECDILVHTGDFTSRGYRGEFQDFATWLAGQPAKHKVFISGNHDFICQKDPAFVTEYLKDLDVHYLLDSFVVLEGLKIYGSPWQPWFHDWAFNFREDDDGTQATACWSQIPDDTDILMTHGPPYQIRDVVARLVTPEEDPSVGCPYLMSRVKEVKPKIHAFGHIHEQYGIVPKDGTLFINGSTCDLQHNPSNLPIVVEL